jgi:hypothetical protein
MRSGLEMYKTIQPSTSGGRVTVPLPRLGADSLELLPLKSSRKIAALGLLISWRYHVYITLKET